MKKSLFFLSILVSIPIAGLKAQTISTEYVTPVVEETVANPIPDGWMPVYSVADLTKQSGWIEIQYGQPVTNPIPDGWMPLFDAAGVQSVKNWIQIGTY